MSSCRKGKSIKSDKILIVKYSYLAFHTSFWSKNGIFVLIFWPKIFTIF